MFKTQVEQEVDSRTQFETGVRYGKGAKRNNMGAESGVYLCYSISIMGQLPTRKPRTFLFTYAMLTCCVSISVSIILTGTKQVYY